MLFNHYVTLALTLVVGATSIVASPLRRSELAMRSEFEQHKSRDIWRHYTRALIEDVAKELVARRMPRPTPVQLPVPVPPPIPEPPAHIHNPPQPPPPPPRTPTPTSPHDQQVPTSPHDQHVPTSPHDQQVPTSPHDHHVPEEGGHHRRRFIEDLVNEIVARHESVEAW